jgi:hypothetical protein
VHNRVDKNVQKDFMKGLERSLSDEEFLVHEDILIEAVCKWSGIRREPNSTSLERFEGLSPTLRG